MGFESYRTAFESLLEAFLFDASIPERAGEEALEAGLSLIRVHEILRASKERRLAPWSESPLALREAMAYVRLAGGKRVRPVLVYAVWDALPTTCKSPEEREKLAPLALAVESIHTYSLVHDDLPCMDDDALRRGLPTLHTHFGEGRALLVGDALLTEAACLLTQLATTWPQTAAQAQALVLRRALSMVQGQWRDLSHSGANVTEEELLRLSYEKTACLIQAPVLAVATLYALPKDVWEACATWSRSLGLAFQIRDDLLDLQATAERLGKTPRKDIKQDKSTFVTCLGEERAQMLLAEETDRALTALAFLERRGWDCAFLREWTRALQKRED